MSKPVENISIEDLNTMWVADSHINDSQLAIESLRVPKLHQKYHILLTRERLLLEALRNRLQEYEVVLEGWYLKTLSQEDLARYKLVYDERRYSKPEVPKLLVLHPTIQAIKNQILTQVEKVKYLESIMQLIMAMNYSIKNSIDMKKFNAGGY